MKPPSFDCIRSLNTQPHNIAHQEKEYDSYLRRISSIVDRKPSFDSSSDFYMTFLEKCKSKSKHLREVQETRKINCENSFLLNKIVKSQSHKYSIPTEQYHLEKEEKKAMEHSKILCENIKIAQRISSQSSVLKKTLLVKEKWKNTCKMQESKVALINKENSLKRKLPKLIHSPEKMRESQFSNFS